MRRLADHVMRGLARLLIRVFFRQVEVQHAERLPASGPVVLVANHLNGLVDGLLLMAMLGRYPRFLGKSTLFKILPLWPFLKLAGVIPVHRVIDGATGDQNVGAFATCHALLAAGGMVALFPEGISHDESTLQPLRTGAARIALEAGIDSEIKGVVTVAVGLTYDAKARFRSRALVRIAEPVNISRWAAFHEADGWDVVRQFTDDVAAQLRTVSPSYESWQQAEQLSRIAEVVVRSPEDDLPAHVNLADREEVAQKLASLEAECGDRLLGLMASFAEYERDLTLLGLSDAQVVAKYPQGKLRGSLVWSLVKVLVALPIAAVGVVIHLIPFQIMKQLAKRPTNEGIKATVKLLGCVVLFAVTYALLGYFMARAFGAWFGLLAALAAPFCGYVAVRMAERIKRIGGLVDGYRTVRGRNAVLATVFSHRTAVVDAVRQLLASK